MKNLKKLSALAISLMMVFSFAGCENSDDSSKKDSSSKTETTTTTSAAESSSDVDSGSSSDTDSKSAEASLKDGVYTTEDYSIELGSDWEESKSVSGIAMFTLGGDATTNINILKESVAQKITAEDYKDAAVKQFEAMEGYKVTDSKGTKIDGNDSYLVYLSAEQSSVKMNLIQAYIVNDSNVFVVTFTTIADKYDDMKEEAEKIIDSFKSL